MKVLVIDTNLSLEHSRRIGRDTTCYYTIICGNPYPTLEETIGGYGFEEIIKVDDWGDVINEVEVVVFADVGFGGMADFLRKEGKFVFGADKKSENLELDRIYMRRTFEKLGIPIAEGKVVKGIDNVCKYIEQAKTKCYVKVNRLRGCFDEKTEILTKKGWKKFSELSKEDYVLTMNPKTREVMYVKPKNLIKYYYEGEMFAYNNGRSPVDFMVTPNHGFIARTNIRTKFRYRLGYDIFDGKNSSVSIPLWFKWSGKEPKYYILKARKYETRNYNERRIPIDLWLKFLGFFLSEGSIENKNRVHQKHKYRVFIAQSKEKNIEIYLKIKNILDELSRYGFNYNIESDRGFSIYNRQLFDELKKTCYASKEVFRSWTKKVPEYVKELSPKLIRIFLDAFFEGDGYYANKNKTEKRYVTSSPYLKDDLQELLFKTGRVATIHIDKEKGENGGQIKGRPIVAKRKIYYVAELKKKDAWISKKDVRKELYKGYVYDVTVEPFHTIFVRRNGKAWWSGNSVETFGTDDPEEARFLLHQGGFQVICDEANFIVEKELDGIEIGVDTFFNGKDYGDLVMDTIEVKGMGNVTRYRVYEDSLWYDILEKLKPYLQKNGYRGMVCFEGFYNGDKIRITDATMRIPYICSYAYPKDIKNFTEVICNTAMGLDVKPKVSTLYSCQVGVYTDNITKWRRIHFPKEFEPKLAFRRVIKVKGNIWFVPGDYVVAVGIGNGATFEQAIDEAKKIADSVETIECYSQGAVLKEKFKERIEKLKELGYEF